VRGVVVGWPEHDEEAAVRNGWDAVASVFGEVRVGESRTIGVEQILERLIDSQRLGGFR
jgi:hypothetical protein